MENVLAAIDSFHDFFIFQLGPVSKKFVNTAEWTPKITKMTKFESDLLKTNDNTALQSQVILQTFM